MAYSLLSAIGIFSPPLLPLAFVAPVAILLLCVLAAVGTIVLLPGTREAAYRKIGAVILIAAALIFVALLLRGAQSTGLNAYFWIFSALALFGAVRVVTHTRPVYSALYFVLTVFASAGLFVLLYANFMAAALILIYAGAILVTYVFVIMLAAEATSGTGGTTGLADHDLVSREPIIASAVGFLLMAVLLSVIFDRAQGLTPPAAAQVAAGALDEEQTVPVFTDTTQGLGVYLYQHQVFSFELAGLILTMSMVGAILISRRRVILAVEPVHADAPADAVVAKATPATDDPHSIPVYGTDNPRQKAYPET